MKIKVKIKHLQKLKLNIFLAKIKYYLEKNLSKFAKKLEKKSGNFRKFENSSSREECGMCRSRKMLKNAYLDAKIGVDTEENEPSKVL